MQRETGIYALPLGPLKPAQLLHPREESSHTATQGIPDTVWALNPAQKPSHPYPKYLWETSCEKQ